MRRRRRIGVDARKTGTLNDHWDGVGDYVHVQSYPDHGGFELPREDTAQKKLH